MQSNNASKQAAPTDFRSDNVTGVAPQIMDAIVAANAGTV